mgnify:CR=1 FL=1
MRGTSSRTGSCSKKEEIFCNKRGWIRANYFYRRPERERERENRRSTGPTLTPASGARVVRLRNNADRGVIVAPRLTARCTAILANISIVRGQQPCHVAFEYLRSPTTDWIRITSHFQLAGKFNAARTGLGTTGGKISAIEACNVPLERSREESKFLRSSRRHDTMVTSYLRPGDRRSARLRGILRKLASSNGSLAARRS